ncbi:unnamed protein product [[Candida] boidinii]|uniref:Unnamed protein product n=1 Tax=Candida boidinii TaxID=5477 RepID=A0ACB5TNQ1_CANBO|nr:unnamed protein product [[Candida] boidinii]
MISQILKKNIAPTRARISISQRNIHLSIVLSNKYDIKPQPSTTSSLLNTQKSQPGQIINDDSVDSNLSQVLAKVIKTTGPIPLATYMRQCLTHPTLGYYTTRNPLDSKSGDFITSPEISSTFGEMLGLWYFTIFIQQLKKIAISKTKQENLIKNNQLKESEIDLDLQKFNIKDKTLRFIEFGPGKGTLMYDVIKTINKFVQSKNPIEINLIEASPVLRNEQKNLLCGKDMTLFNRDGNLQDSTTIWGNTIKWYNTELDILNEIKSNKENQNENNYINFIIAHEFFDALPINQFEKTDKGWREFLVDIKKESNTDILLPNVSHYNNKNIVGNNQKNEANEKFPKFNMVLAPYATPSSSIPKIIPRFNSVSNGSRIEICPESYNYAIKISELLTNFTENDSKIKMGSALIVDYGTSESIPINTLRGIKNHKIVNPFEDAGEVDLSADVDFGNLKDIFKDNNCESYIVDQGDFLNGMGLGYRTDQLVESLKENEQEKKKIIDAYNRLTGKGIRDMGKIYKVMGVVPNDSIESAVGFVEPPKPVRKEEEPSKPVSIKIDDSK